MNQIDNQTIVERLRLLRGNKSPIVRDMELACFILDGLLGLKADDVRKSCLSRFGPKRTPSRSAIFRFWSNARAEMQRGQVG